MRLACRDGGSVFAKPNAVGTIFMTFVGGRPVAVVVNFADFPIPKEYSPIRAR